MTRWKVGLSNGENFIEGVAPFERIKGEDSPWLKLLAYCKQNNIDMTSLCLIHGSRTFNLPSAGTNPKFKAFSTTKKPIGFDFGRPFSITQGEPRELFAMIVAIYDDHQLQLWVDERNPNNCWVLTV